MDSLLQTILQKAAIDTNPETLAAALRLAEEIRAARDAEVRALELRLQNNEAQSQALALDVRSKELDLELSRTRNSSGVSTVPGDNQSAGLDKSLRQSRANEWNFSSPSTLNREDEKYPDVVNISGISYSAVCSQPFLEPATPPTSQTSADIWSATSRAAFSAPSNNATNLLTAVTQGTTGEMPVQGHFHINSPAIVGNSDAFSGVSTKAISLVSPVEGAGQPTVMDPTTSYGLAAPYHYGNQTFPATDQFLNTYPARYNRNNWNDSFHALFTFGLEDFGHTGMPRVNEYYVAVENLPTRTAVAADPALRASPLAGTTLGASYHVARERDSPVRDRASLEQYRPPDTSESPELPPKLVHPSPPTSQSSRIHSASSTSQRKKKQIVEEEARCRRCGKLVAIYLLHGNDVSLNTTYRIDVLCCNCGGCDNGTGQRSSSAHTSALVPGSRKRTSASKEDERATCEVCKRQVAIGGVRLVGKEHEKDPNSDPDFGVEVICSNCRNKYALCTECGGGGKYRTGKWRPLGLFQPGRRTCRLPHVRIGSTPIHFQEWLVPSSLSANPEDRSLVLRDIDKCVPCMYFHRLAIPEVMELDPPNELATFEQLQCRVALRCQSLRDFVLGPDIEQSHGVRRYFGAAWIKRVSRHLRKERGTKGANSRRQEPSEGDLAGSPSGRTPGGGPDKEENGHPTKMVAMLVMWWDMKAGCLRLAALQALNTEFTTGGIIFRMCRRVMERCVADQEAMATANPSKAPPPISILGLPVFEEFARLQAVQHTLERLGFLPLQEFERQHPEIDPDVIERSLLDRDGLFGGPPQYPRSFFVGNVKHLLAGPWGKESKSGRGRKIEDESIEQLVQALSPS
ncbi:hypothetical protein SpCBS45565_g07259 [Spizellomyces sp. 'palustris']|nr:hypothetical protein SpCBS45565_g07259 [Spizellomyces sp. 'palustris']